MKVISLKVAEIIDGEAKERDELSAKLDHTVKDLKTLLARVTAIESTASAVAMADLTALNTRITAIEERAVSVTHSEIADLRANIAGLQARTTTEVEKVNATVQGVQTSLSQSIPTIFADAETFRTALGGLQGQLNGIRQYSTEQYQQLCHSQRVLQSWQDQFSTKTIYRDIVAQIQQLVPSGTLVRLTNMEVRIEKMESAASYDRVQGLDSRLATVEQAVLRSGSPLANGIASG
jgi:chromosome segregation ATPase